MTAVSEQLRPLGMATGFHNHQTEWTEVDGKRPMDVLAAGTPKDFVLQFDVGTCLEAGRRSARLDQGEPRPDPQHALQGLVEGRRATPSRSAKVTAPWKAIFAAAEASGGIEYYLIEQEIAGPDGSARHGPALPRQLQEAAGLTRLHLQSGL